MSIGKNSYLLSLVIKERETRRESIRRAWFRFKKNKPAVAGLVMLCGILVVATLADYITPYPKHAGLYIDFANRYKPPSLAHLLGTDMYGRDVFTRVIFGFRYALMTVATVLGVVVPVGTILGLIAGYYKGTIIDHAIMGLAEVFVAVPPLVLALAICSVLEPNVFNALLAITLMWWPWYTRMVYSMTSSLRNEPYVWAAKAVGVGTPSILFRELLPNILGPILTKATLDASWVIIIGASISFVGLGAQPPTPDLGTMLSEYCRYLPDYWWMTLGPLLGIVILVLSFNLVGDGLRDVIAGGQV
ncbi:MAG: ABC transporter permease [Sulfolobales archaeon]